MRKLMLLFTLVLFVSVQAQDGPAIPVQPRTFVATVTHSGAYEWTFGKIKEPSTTLTLCFVDARFLGKHMLLMGPDKLKAGQYQAEFDSREDTIDIQVFHADNYSSGGGRFFKEQYTIVFEQ